MSVGELAAGYAECERIVQEGDPDRAVSVGFAAPERRKHLFALYAFHLETLRVRDLVSQPLPGEIRLQWWRDRIDSSGDVEEAAQGSPVAMALIDTIRAFELPVDAFERYLEARVFDLYNDPMPSRIEFEAYAGETASALVMFAAMVLDRSQASGVADACGHAGVAQTAVSALRAAPLHRSRHQVYLPGDLLAATGVEATAWLSGGEGAERAQAAMAAFALDHLERVERNWGRIPRVLRPAFLPARLGRKLLAKDASEPGPLSRLWLYWRWMRA